MLLRLTDGTTTLTLSGSGTYLGATYFPDSRPGDARITETFPLTLEGTESAIRGAVQDIEQLFAAARNRDRALTARVFAEFRPIDSGDILRAEVFDGSVSWSQVPAERSMYATLSTVRINVTWERAAGWEGPEEELYLSSYAATDVQGGVNIYNNDNASGTPNWVGIAANRVKGTRPAPIRLRITNNSGSSLAWRNFFIGINAYSAPASADVWLLGSEATGGATASWSSSVGHNSLQWLIPFSNTLLGQTQGRTFRIIGAFTSVSSDASTALRASVGAYVSSVYTPNRFGPERVGAGRLIDFGEFPIPPGGYNVANASAAMAITARASGVGGGGTLDFVMLMATDSYRRLRQIGYNTANAESLEDDGIEGGAYILSGSNRYPIIRAAGPPLMVYPERVQRMYILFDEDGVFTPGRLSTVRAWYRPVYDNV
jgi:hypothetical protein